MTMVLYKYVLLLNMADRFGIVLYRIPRIVSIVFPPRPYCAVNN